MRYVSTAGCLIFCALSSTASARAPEDFAASWAVCESGRASAQYLDARDSCWGAFEAARARRDYSAALAAAGKGCEKYRRADYCMFMAQLPKEARGAGVVRVGTEQARLGQQLELALSVVKPADVEDAEWGTYMGALRTR